MADQNWWKEAPVVEESVVSGSDWWKEAPVVESEQPVQAEPPSYLEGIGSMFRQAGEVAVEAGQSVVQDFAPGVARGAISAVGSQIEGVELGFAADIDSAFDKLNRIDLGESIAPQTPAEVEWLTKYKLGSDQDRENIRSSLLDKRMAAMHEGIGKSVREYGVETFPSDDPAAFSSKVGEAFGSSVPMLIEGYLGARGGRAVG